MDGWHMEWPVPECTWYFSQAEICRKVPETPQQERFSPNFRLRISQLLILWSSLQKHIRHPNHHYFEKKTCSTPPSCIAVLSLPQSPQDREVLSVLLPLVSWYASRLYRNLYPHLHRSTFGEHPGGWGRWHLRPLLMLSGAATGICDLKPLRLTPGRSSIPPPLPPYLAIRHFSGDWGLGMYILRPPRQELFSPLFYTTPPPLEGCFQGCGGGVYNLAPVFIVIAIRNQCSTKEIHCRHSRPLTRAQEDS